VPTFQSFDPPPIIRAMSRIIGVLAVVVLALGVAAVAVAAKNKPPATGEYVADLEVNGTYGQGGWVVTKEGGKRLIVAAPQYNGIYYPDPGKCDNYSLPLAATSIPIAKNGKFKIKETTPVPGTEDKVKVDWKGKWKSATKVVGTIKLASGNCKTSNEFTAQKVG
jgi:hypothetical protein